MGWLLIMRTARTAIMSGRKSDRRNEEENFDKGKF